MSYNNSAKFDQVVRGNVRICKKDTHTYTITFLKASEFTLYQVFNETGSGNNKRLVVNDNTKQWQQSLINAQKAIGFEPTCLLEINLNRYACVITNAEFINNQLIFRVTTKPIKNYSITVKKGFPTGTFKNVRFDIDSLSSCGGLGFVGSPVFCF